MPAFLRPARPGAFRDGALAYIVIIDDLHGKRDIAVTGPQPDLTRDNAR